MKLSLVYSVRKFGIILLLSNLIITSGKSLN